LKAGTDMTLFDAGAVPFLLMVALNTFDEAAKLKTLST
jgi:hypothetical protein